MKVLQLIFLMLMLSFSAAVPATGSGANTAPSDDAKWEEATARIASLATRLGEARLLLNAMAAQRHARFATFLSLGDSLTKRIEPELAQLRRVLRAKETKAETVVDRFNTVAPLLSELEIVVFLGLCDWLENKEAAPRLHGWLKLISSASKKNQLELGIIPFFYARIYETGTGVPQDIKKAARWYNRALRGHNSTAAWFSASLAEHEELLVPLSKIQIQANRDVAFQLGYRPQRYHDLFRQLIEESPTARELAFAKNQEWNIHWQFFWAIAFITLLPLPLWLKTSTERV